MGQHPRREARCTAFGLLWDGTLLGTRDRHRERYREGALLGLAERARVEQRGRVVLEKTGVVCAGGEVGVSQKPLVEGQVGPDPRHHVLAQRAPHARQRLGEAATLDAEFDEGTPPEAVLADMLAWFRKRQESEIAQGITRQLRANDTNLSETDTTLELQRRLEAKRAALGLS